MNRLSVPLPPWALDALHRLADRSQRTQRQQAAFLISEGLKPHERRASRGSPVERGGGDGPR